jgi:hypothetical protein
MRTCLARRRPPVASLGPASSAVSEQRARPQTPGWIWGLALLCFLVSVMFAFGALIYLGMDCTDDAGGGCENASYGQFGIALMGVVLSVAALIAAAVRLRPGFWLCAAAVTLASWILVAFAIGESA